MNRFACPTCTRRVFFDDPKCLACGTLLAYDPGPDSMGYALIPSNCRHRDEWSCNWLADGSEGGQCQACRLDVAVAGPLDEIVVFQSAKRRMVRQLYRIGLHPDETDPPLRFELMHGTDDSPVTIGHANGLVTLDISEGNLAHLESVRRRLGEPYRTPLGHIRHEAGHWHWEVFVVSDQRRLEQFRDMFGDERTDYSEALQRHYAAVDDGSWRPDYLSHYATAHPWEDYAESFAHLLHMWDMVETGVAEGFIEGDFRGISEVYERWVPLTVSLNEMARSMGTAEPYPFAPPEPALRKIMFVFDIVNSSTRTNF